MSRRIVPLPGRGWTVETEDEEPLELPTPLEDMARVAEALRRHDDGEAGHILEEGRRRLQRAITHELHRLVGEMVCEVAIAQVPADRITRAIAFGSKLLDSRPPEHIIASCADPDAFVARCRAACDALVVYVAAAINESLTRAGIDPMQMPETLVRDAARELHQAQERNAANDLDGKAKLAFSYMAQIGLQTGTGAFWAGAQTGD
jgi:hypothetical protein